MISSRTQRESELQSGVVAGSSEERQRITVVLPLSCHRFHDELNINCQLINVTEKYYVKLSSSLARAPSEGRSASDSNREAFLCLIVCKPVILPACVREYVGVRVRGHACVRMCMRSFVRVSEHSCLRVCIPLPTPAAPKGQRKTSFLLGVRVAGRPRGEGGLASKIQTITCSTCLRR